MRTSMVPLKIIIVLVSMLFLFPEIIISQRKACQLLNDGEFLWLSINDQLNKYNKNTGELLTYNAPGGSLGKDKSGKIWIMKKYGEIYTFDGQNATPYTIKGLNRKEKHSWGNNSFLVGKNNGKWMGLLFETNNAFLIQFDDLGFNKWNFNTVGSSVSILSMLEDKEGITWFSGYNEISPPWRWTFGRFTKTGGIITYKELQWLSITAIDEDSEGNLWMSTNYNQNLLLIKFDHQHFSYIKDSGPGNHYSLVIDTYNHKWLGNIDGTLTRYDGKQFTTYSHPELTQTIRDLVPDENGYIWILADNKLFCYNPSIDNIQKIDFLLSGEEYFTTNSEHKIYPNPSTHQITITGENILQVKAYDMSGQFLGKHIENFGKKSVTIELSTLGITTKGYYVLCIEENTSIYHHKIQVKK